MKKAMFIEDKTAEIRNTMYNMTFTAKLEAYIKELQAKYKPTEYDKIKNNGHYGNLFLNPRGNEKLKNSKRVRFLIWSVPAVKTCPFATALCMHFCYAKRTEDYRDNVKICHEKNLLESLRPDFVEHMIEMIEYFHALDVKKNRKTLIRIHESGDFYSQEYFDKWIAIARHFEGQKMIKFTAYTKSVEYVHDVPDVMTIRYSLWKDTDRKQYSIAKRKGLSTYTAENLTDNEVTALGNRFCDCINCGTCQKCYYNGINSIVTRIHK